MSKIVFITGATSGIGLACATLFAENGWNIIVNGRREDRLNALCDQLTQTHSVEVLPLVFDVRKQKDVEKAVEQLPEKWTAIDLLINNAGLALGLSALPEGDLDDWETMIDTNVKGLLYVTRAVSPLMIGRQQGHIINIGSIAGKETYANGNVYCATKHAVDSLTKAMRVDMLTHNIRVTAVNPGAVETEFSIVRFKGDEQKAKNFYKGFDPLYANDIAEVVYFAANRPPHVTINDIVVMPTAQATATQINRE